MSEPAYGVVGGGLVGLATAAQLARAGRQVVVFEKEPGVARHQSGHNSGVVHSGIYYAPGSAKAGMCRRGVSLLRDYCAQHHLPWDARGKLIVARDVAEREKLRELHRRAGANGVPDVQWLDGPAIREIEPEIAGVAALLSPTTAIVDYPAIARALAGDVRGLGGRVLTSCPVTAISPDGSGVEVRAGGETHRLTGLVICAGLQSDRVARLAGFAAEPQIVAFRGEYLRLRPHAAGRVRRLIYPVPDPAYPFLGVHLTPRLYGSVDIGPNAVLAMAREGYRRRDVSWPELKELAGSQAFRRLAVQHWRMGLRELRGSLVRRAFIAEARTYLPWLTAADVESAPAGVRAQAVDPDGSLVDDFRIQRSGAVVALRNAPSPAATASLAIAEQLAEEITGNSTGGAGFD